MSPKKLGVCMWVSLPIHRPSNPLMLFLSVNNDLIFPACVNIGAYGSRAITISDASSCCDIFQFRTPAQSGYAKKRSTSRLKPFFIIYICIYDYHIIYIWLLYYIHIYIYISYKIIIYIYKGYETWSASAVWKIPCTLSTSYLNQLGMDQNQFTRVPVLGAPSHCQWPFQDPKNGGTYHI